MIPLGGVVILFQELECFPKKITGEKYSTEDHKPMPPKKQKGENMVQAVLRSSRQRRSEGRSAFEPHNAMYASIQGDRKLVWSLVLPYAQQLLQEEESLLKEKIQSDKEKLRFVVGAKLHDTQFELGLVEFAMDTSQRFNLKLIGSEEGNGDDWDELQKVASKNYFHAKEEHKAHQQMIMDDLGKLLEFDVKHQELYQVIKDLPQ